MNFFQNFFEIKKKKTQLKIVFSLVEAAGVEPASENIFIQASPGAVCGLHSLHYKSADKLIALVASLVMFGSKLCQSTFTADWRPSQSRGTPWLDGCLN